MIFPGRVNEEISGMGCTPDSLQRCVKSFEVGIFVQVILSLCYGRLPFVLTIIRRNAENDKSLVFKLLIADTR